MKRILLLLLASLFALTGCDTSTTHTNIDQEELPMNNGYIFPAEEAVHEGTWLNWPHHHTYGMDCREEIEPIWIEMAAALQEGERIHIIAYDEVEKKRISSLLTEEQLDMNQIDFAFDGWGKKMPFENDDKISAAVAKSKNIPIVSVPDFVLEGGSVELDGAGTLMATKSSVISKNRNTGMTVAQAEAYLKKYLGVTNFIWMDGVTDEDITDAHIDGMARFCDEQTLLTVSEDDFFELYEGTLERDYELLCSGYHHCTV